MYRPHQSPATYAVPLLQDQARGPPPFYLHSLSKVNDGGNNLTSAILSHITPLQSHLTFLVYFTATTQGHKPALHALWDLSRTTDAQLRRLVADFDTIGLPLEQLMDFTRRLLIRK